MQVGRAGKGIIPAREMVMNPSGSAKLRQSWTGAALSLQRGARERRDLGLCHAVGPVSFPSRGSCRSAGPEAGRRRLCPSRSRRRQSSAPLRAARPPERRAASRGSSPRPILLQLLCRDTQGSSKSASSPPAASRGHQHQAQHCLTLLLASAGPCPSHTLLIAEAKLGNKTETVSSFYF